MKPRILFAALLSLVLVQGGLSPALAASSKTTSKATTSASNKASQKKAVAKTSTRKAKQSTAKRATKKVVAKRSAPAAEESAELALDSKGNPLLKSSAFYVANQATGEVLLEKNGGAVVPIASITKLMTAMVVLEASPSLSEELTIDEEDIDQLKGTGSRLSLGTRMTREELLRLALMSSENRAASTLARHYPGGLTAFVNAMNIKARLLSMTDTRFHDSTGLNPANVSSPRDLARLVAAASRYPLIREFSTTAERYVEVRGRQLRFGNTNSLVKNPDWEISVSKTGYISEAGRCLVMQAWINQQPVVIVLMDSVGRYTRTADAQRVRKWIDSRSAERVAAAPKAKQG
ncbi:D-alanyl-D-alanine endopeptidase [Parazoarcus communis]|uniref:D-alanyl-D-alanine endopeptidase n=1 Tax=Parazoarcus communis TaxID=41977 RepID=A0A2U8GUV4_9RHOO|nr:D-alanyl-D-alanine endopeptidase [Parazoarcus communis]AWI77053.1 D-alanyl-D-alanine endopeptidase [Parazoarcus communis]